jgi:exopolysaccharide production protein ExoZ
VIQNIQTLRVIFALVVIAGHLDPLFFAMSLPNPADMIGIANDGFLIVSAFVIIHVSLRKPTTPLHFLGRRFARLVPFYWAITLLVAALVIVAPTLFKTTQVTAETLAKSLLFIPYIKHNDIVQPIVFVGWTMNYIVFFIALYAMFLRFFGRNAWMATSATLAGLALLGVVFQPTDVVLKFFTGPRQVSFALGALMAGLWFAHPVRPARLKSLNLRALALGLIAVAFAIRVSQEFWLPDFDMRFFGPFVSCAVVLGVLLLESNGDVHKGAMRDRIAEATFSIYLTHMFVTQAVLKTMRAFELQNIGMLLILLMIAFAGSIVLGLFVCKWIEKPLDKSVRDAWRWVAHRPMLLRRQPTD